MSAQPSLFKSRDNRKPTKRWVQAFHLRAVADIVDPEHGDDEIPPTPGLDQTGTTYAVGIEREIWTRLETGGTLTADGRVLGPKEAFKEMHRRGARIMRLERSWLPGMSRSSIDARLIEDWHISREIVTAESGPAPSSCPRASSAWARAWPAWWGLVATEAP